jgi:hypothetical protein
MKTARALLLAFGLLPLAVPAAEEPEAVYAKFHRGAVTGNLEEIVRHKPAAQRAEIAAMSAAQKAATAKMTGVGLPRAFLLQNKTLTKGGQGALLLVSGPGEIGAGGKPEMLYGSIRMVMEGGEWKVDEMGWTNVKPAALASAKPAAGAAAPKAQAAQPPRGGTVIGTQAERKFGTARPPCVYKAVMTAEDVENCK